MPVLPNSQRRYSGPAYSFGTTPELVLGPKPDVNVLVTSIANILTTPKGSIPWDPNAGSWVPYLLFDPNDDINKQLALYYTRKDIEEQDPRVIVKSVISDQPDDHTILIRVAFAVAGDPTTRIYAAPVIFAGTT